MSMLTGSMPSARSAFSRLIDYAGLFPPAKLDMAPAVAEYCAARLSGESWMLGRFIVPASRSAELLAALPGDERVALSVILDAENDARTWLNSAQSVFAAIAVLRARTERAAIETLEVLLPRLASQRDSFDAAIGQCAMLAEQAGLRDLPIYVEFPRDARTSLTLPESMAALARYRLRAKVRCGGVTPDAYPSPSELAAFISAAAEAGVAFKATAGLHHPIRHFNAAAGVKMHGFLNILAATATAPDASVDSLAAILESEDSAAFRFEPEALVAAGRRFSCDAIARARESFVAYGSCSFSEPIADLIALCVLSK